MTQLPQPVLLLVAASPEIQGTLAGDLERWSEGKGLHLETLYGTDPQLLREALSQKRMGGVVLDARGQNAESVCRYIRKVRSQNSRTRLMVLRDRGPLPELLRREARERSVVCFASSMVELGTLLSTALHVRDENEPESSMRRRSPGNHTAARALETLRDNQKLIEVGRLASSIAHEINNPLESITNLLYLARQEPGLPPIAAEYLEMAEHEMDRVVTISKQTLNFSRETSQPVNVALSELLDEVLVLYRRRLNEKHIQVERRYSPAKPALIFPGEMRQVFSNLITNAIEACGTNGIISLRVRMASPMEEGGEPGVRVTIADNGGGIPPQIRHRLGEPFFTTKGQRGTGLGLWVTRSIVQRYGGRLRLRSTQHAKYHGTVFSLFLPLGKGPQANATIHTLTSEPGATGLGSRSTRTPRRNRPIPFRHAVSGR